MSDETTVEVNDVKEVIEKASAPEVFDVLDFVKGASLPVNEVEIYTDAESAFELAKIVDAEKEINDRVESEGLGIADELPSIDEERVKALKDKVEASKLIFKLRGLAPAAANAIEANAKATTEYVEGGSNEDYFLKYNTTVIAKSIVSVTSGNKIDAKPWDAERVQALADAIQTSEFNKLWNKAWELTYTSNLFDKVINADF